MAWDEVVEGLTDKSQVQCIKQMCTERVSKYGLTSVKGGACKGCPFRYRGSNPLFCCTFGNLPKDWSDESINRVYKS